jgi:hypothetical protein
MKGRMERRMRGRRGENKIKSEGNNERRRGGK